MVDTTEKHNRRANTRKHTSNLLAKYRYSSEGSQWQGHWNERLLDSTIDCPLVKAKAVAVARAIALRAGPNHDKGRHETAIHYHPRNMAVRHETLCQFALSQPLRTIYRHQS